MTQLTAGMRAELALNLIIDIGPVERDAPGTTGQRAAVIRSLVGFVEVLTRGHPDREEIETETRKRLEAIACPQIAYALTHCFRAGEGA